TFEHRVLDPLPIIDAGFCHLAQALAPGGGFGVDIIGDKYQHTVSSFIYYFQKKGGYRSMSPRSVRASSSACTAGTSPHAIFSPKKGCWMACCLRCCQAFKKARRPSSVRRTAPFSCF